MHLARINRRLIAHIVRLMVAVMLFAQGASLALACERALGALPAAVTEQPCHEPNGDNQGRCITHCATAHQAVDKPEIAFTKSQEAPLLFRVASVSLVTPLQLPVLPDIDPRAEPPPDSRSRVLRI